MQVMLWATGAQIDRVAKMGAIAPVWRRSHVYIANEGTIGEGTWELVLVTAARRQEHTKHACHG